MCGVTNRESLNPPELQFTVRSTNGAGWVIIIFAFWEFKGRYQAHCIISYINGPFRPCLNRVHWSSGGNTIPAGVCFMDVLSTEGVTALRVHLDLGFRNHPILSSEV